MSGGLHDALKMYVAKTKIMFNRENGMSNNNLCINSEKFEQLDKYMYLVG